MFLLKHRKLSFTKFPSQNVLDNLFKKYLHIAQISQSSPWSPAASLHFVGHHLVLETWLRSCSRHPLCKISLKAPQAAGHRKLFSTWRTQSGGSIGFHRGSPYLGRASELMNSPFENVIKYTFSSTVFLCVQGVGFILCLTRFHSHPPPNPMVTEVGQKR